MKEINLKNLCHVFNGYAFKSENYTKRGVRIIRITNVKKGYIDDSEPKYYNLNKTDKLKNYLLKENDLLISLTGNVGRVGLVDKKILPAGLNQRVACLRAKDSEIIDINYLYQYLNNNKFENECIKNSKGVAQKNLSTEWIKKYIIKIPEIKEQKEITYKLKKVQDIILKKKDQIKELNEVIKSQFVEMFGDPVFNNKNWKYGIIRDLVKDVRYGTSRPANENGRFKYLRMNNITYDGKLDITELKNIDIPDNELEKCIAEKGDILFNRTNSRDLVGKTCVYDLDDSMVIAGFVIRVRTNELANPYFVSEFLNSKYMKKRLSNMCKNASGQSNINAQEMQNIKIYIPPIELQNQFAEFVKQIDKQKFEELNVLEKELNKIQKNLDYKWGK